MLKHYFAKFWTDQFDIFESNSQSKMLSALLILVAASVANVLSSPDGAAPGGFRPMDQTDPQVKEQVQNLTKFAVKTLDAKANDQYHSQLVRVSDAQYQIVQGANYRITFYIGQSKCQRDKVISIFLFVTNTMLLDQRGIEVQHNLFDALSLSYLQEKWEQQHVKQTLSFPLHFSATWCNACKC